MKPVVFILFLGVFEIYQCQVFVYNQSPKIVSQTVFGSDCVDRDGNIRSHLEEWSTVAGGCDVNYCYDIGETLKFKITNTCPDKSDQNVDPSNCIQVSNTTAAFPDCCPRIQCSEGSIPVVTTPACFDRSPSWACQIWKDNTNCVTSSDINLQTQYNITIEYCRLTCGYC